jgi:hypothetical protein
VRSVCVGLLMAFIVMVSPAQTPVVRAHLEPASGILVGQPVRLVVSVFVPNYFTGSPDFPEFELDNAIVVLPQDRPQNSNEQIGGVTYAGITETYTIYPQQPGDFRLPPAQLTVSYASAPPQSTSVHLSLPGLTFHADIPPAAQNLDYFLPTTSLTIQQRWSSPLKNLRAGDSVERTITVTAAKMQAMLIPPLPLETPDGIRVYPEEPIVQDQKTDRGDFVFGRRTQSAKYFIQRGGDYTLPAIELKWWNLSTNRLVSAVLPAVHFTAAANANYTAELPPEPEPVAALQPRHINPWVKYRFWIRVIAPCCIALAFLFWMGWRYLPRFYRYLQERRKRWEHSETAYFFNLQVACRRDHAMKAYKWLLKWIALAYPGMSIDGFLSRTSDPALESETNALGAALFTDRQIRWHGKRMADLLKRHRRNRNRDATEQRAWVKLNP